VAQDETPEISRGAKGKVNIWIKQRERKEREGLDDGQRGRVLFGFPWGEVTGRRTGES